MNKTSEEKFAFSQRGWRLERSQFLKSRFSPLQNNKVNPLCLPQNEFPRWKDASYHKKLHLVHIVVHQCINQGKDAKLDVDTISMKKCYAS